MSRYRTLEKTLINRILPFFLLSTFIFTAVSQYNQMRSQYIALFENLSLQLERLAFEIKNPLWNLDYQQLDEISEIVIKEKNTVGISVLNENGEYLSSKGINFSKEDLNVENEFQSKDDFLQNQKIQKFISLLFKNKEYEHLFLENKNVYFTSDSDDYFIGTIYLIYSDRFLISNSRKVLLNLAFFIICAFLLYTFFIFISYHSIVIRPLHILQNSILTATDNMEPFSIPTEFSTNEIDNLQFIFKKLWKNQISLTESLKFSKDYYHQLLESQPMGLVLSDSEGQLNFYNKSFAEIIGFELEELKKMSFWELLPEVSHQDQKEKREKLLASGIPFYQEQEMIHKSGKLVPVSLNTSFIIKKNQKLFWSSVEDISKRLEVQRALEQSEKFLKETDSIAKVGGWEYNRESEELFWTDEVYSIHELKDDYIPDVEKAIDFYHPDDRITVKNAVNNALTDGVSFNLEARLITAKGKLKWVIAIGKPIIIDNCITGILGTFQDITIRKESEQEKTDLKKQVSHMNKVDMLGQLAGGIAHDFNNILTPIIGYVEIAMKRLSDNTKEYEYLERVLMASKRASELVKQILTFSHNNEFDLQPLEAQIIIKEVLKLFRSSIPSYIKVSQDIDMDCALVMADPIHIHQIVMNLCTNAYHAIEGPEGEITIEYKKISFPEEEYNPNALAPGSYVSLIVSDTGRGMEQDVLDRIFEPYFTTKDKSKGTGLGLAITHKIVSDYGGHISVESTPGYGSTFKIILPVIEEISKNMSPIKHENLATGSEHILLVDDELPIAEMEKEILETLGYEVTMKVNSYEALSYYKEHISDIDLVLTDLTMPDMTGVVLASEILKINKDIPIIICTGYSDSLLEETLRNESVKEIIMKPISMEVFSKSIRKAIDQNNLN